MIFLKPFIYTNFNYNFPLVWSEHQILGSFVVYYNYMTVGTCPKCHIIEVKNWLRISTTNEQPSLNEKHLVFHIETTFNKRRVKITFYRYASKFETPPARSTLPIPQRRRPSCSRLNYLRNLVKAE